MAAYTNGTNGKAKSNNYPPYQISKQDILEKARREKLKSQKSWTAGIFSMIIRILAWYSIITIAFRCPSSSKLLNETSPRICKPYLTLRETVSPHLEPYYDEYAAPYVEKVKPYYNSVDTYVFTPVTAFGKKYGAPRVAQAQDVVYKQWTKTVQPHLVTYGNEAKLRYDQNLAPYVEKASEAVGPYYGIAKSTALQSYYETVLPTYNTVKPHVIYVYDQGSDFLVNTGIPYTQWAWTSCTVFIERKLWPRIRILYGENVEPQLIRIGERLGRYRDGKKLKAVIEEMDISSTTSSSTQVTASTSLSSSTSQYSTITPSSTPSSSSQAAAPASADSSAEAFNQQQVKKSAQEVVADDLRNWQERFAKAADEGSDELDERVTEITNTFIKSQADGVGEAMIIELEETVKSQIKTLQKTINSVVERAPENPEDEITSAVRKAGVAIKNKIQAARTWRQNYDQEINSLLEAASKEIFDIIDSIRELGLTEIGMRWAWIEGVTWKDWKKYHALKDKFDEWRSEVEEVVTQHPGLVKAREAAKDIEDRATAIGSDAAQELMRLKEVAKWKVATGDSSDDFSTKVIPAAVENAAQKIMEKISDIGEAISGKSTGTVESVSSAASEAASSVADQAQSIVSAAKESASSAADAVSSSVIGTQQGTVESVTSAAKESASSLSDKVSSAVIGSSQGTAESVISKASESASSLAAQVSSAVIGSEPGKVEKASSSVQSAASIASDSLPKVEDVSSAAQAVLSEASSSASSIASDVSESASSAASAAGSSASSKVWGGANAQVVEARDILYDDDIIENDDGKDSYSQKILSMASEAGDSFTEVTKAVSEALLGTKTTQGSLESATSLAAEQYSSAFAAASKVLYGTPQAPGESILSVATEKYSEAVAAASAAIYGTTKSPMESISSVAASKLSEGLSAASAQYSNIKTAIGATPTPASEKILSQAQNQYYMGIGLAHERYKEFIAAASEAIIPTPTPAPTPTPSDDSKYNSAYSNMKENVYLKQIESAEKGLSSATSVASAALVAGVETISKLAKNAEETARAEKLISLASVRYNQAMSEASQSFSAASSKASVLVYGTETGAFESMTSAAGEQVESLASAASSSWEDLVSAASVKVYGQPTPVYESIYSQATQGVAAQYEAVQAVISELVIGKEPDFTESVYSRLSSAYYTGAPDAYSSASSYASEVYDEVTSAVASVFTPPPVLEDIIDNVSSQLDAAIKTASVQIYGSKTGYAEAASSSISNAAESAASAISLAIYGTPTPTGIVDSVTSVIGENIAKATDAVDAAYSRVFGVEEMGAVESAEARVELAVRGAEMKLGDLARRARAEAEKLAGVKKDEL